MSQEQQPTEELPRPDEPIVGQNYRELTPEELIENLPGWYVLFAQEREHDGDKWQSWSLWIRDGEHEYPVIQNTGGMTVFCSRSTDVGDAIELPEEFFNIISYGYHDHICFMGTREVHESVEEVEEIFEYELSDPERWAVNVILNQTVFGSDIIPELDPIVEYIDRCTEWKVAARERARG